MERRPPAACLALLAALALVPPLTAQQASAEHPGTAYMSRDDLHDLIARMEGAIGSPVYSEPIKARARDQEAAARTRLEEGDFQVGDRVLLVVQGESSLTDTFTVRPGHELVLPIVGTVSLKGVLHGELTSYLSSQLARTLRDPRVQARSMVRVAIEGAVARPGFYSVPVGSLLGDALMVAGGLSPTAQLGQARVERNGQEVLSGGAFRQATGAGQTLDQLDIRAGDRIVIPERGVGLGGPEGTLRTVGTLLSLPLTIFAVTQLF